MFTFPRPIAYADAAQAVQRLQGQFVLRGQLDDPTSEIFTLWFSATPTPAQPSEIWALNVHCAWRTVEAGKMLCSSPEAIEGYTEPALQALLGLQVATVTLSEFGDLSIGFTSGRALHLWNNAPYEQGDSWLLSLPGQGEYAVAMRNEFTYDPENRYSF